MLKVSLAPTSRAIKNTIASKTKLEAKNFLCSGVAAVPAVASDLFRVGAVAILWCLVVGDRYS